MRLHSYGLGPTGQRLKRAAKLPRAEAGEQKLMTVCVAGLFQWNYGTNEVPDWGRAGILLSDRMLTAGDVQYEPNQRKWADIGSNACLAIAGDVSLHSQAIKDTYSQLRGDPQPHPYDVALIYGRAIQAIKRRVSEDLYLAPLGLNTDTLIAQTCEISEGLTNALMERLHGHEGAEVEAPVVGSSQVLGSSQSHAQIYSVDTKGTVSCMDDIGFAAIGIGSGHAKSLLMQAGYTNIGRLAPAVSLLYGAKRAAEAAPGVGRATDIQVIMRHGRFPLWPDFQRRLEDLYNEYRSGIERLAWDSIMKLNDYLGSPEFRSGTDAEAQRPVPENTQSDGSAATPAAETARKNETGSEVKDG